MEALKYWNQYWILSESRHKILLDQPAMEQLLSYDIKSMTLYSPLATYTIIPTLSCIWLCRPTALTGEQQMIVNQPIEIGKTVKVISYAGKYMIIYRCKWYVVNTPANAAKLVLHYLQ